VTGETVPEETTRRLRGLVAARSVADRERVDLETVDLDEAMNRGPGADDVTGRLESALSAQAHLDDEVGDPVEYQRALDTLLRATRSAARKLDAYPAAPLTATEAMVLEAVIRTDGSRPSLLVRDGAVDANHPTAGDWSGTFAQTREALRGPIAAVGRVEPANPSGRNFFGTCWVVDADAGLALTNRHVVEAIWRRIPFRIQRTERGFLILDGAFVDFVAESGSARTNRFKVVEAVVPTDDGPGFERLDAAVLTLEPIGAGGLPPAVPVRADPDGPVGNLFSFCVVGFPGPPAYSGGVHEGVDWTWVNTTLFGNRYGVKRLAPGTAHRPLGSFDDDTRHWVFGHDPTTLGGNSGSPVLNWLDPEPGGFGLHFAGASVDTNIAHAIVACAEQLRRLGVPVRELDP
jgi:Trypsin-like peptidase domain